MAHALCSAHGCNSAYGLNSNSQLKLRLLICFFIYQVQQLTTHVYYLEVIIRYVG